MALTMTEVSELYVSIFGRASEGEGNTYWQTDQPDRVSTANTMLATEAAQNYFGSSLDSDQAFIEHIYVNTLGKTYVDDPAGIDYWVGELAAGKSRGEVVVALVDAAQDPVNAGAAQDQFLNKVAVSDYCTQTIPTADPNDLSDFTAYIAGVTDDPATVAAAVAAINADIDVTTFTLTADTDIATASIFNAPMVFVPDGSDRILSLQDEDVLTGTLGLSNTLNVTMGNANADEGTTGVVTPNLINIQDINIDWTGNTTTLDIRNADATEAVNIQRVTADATAVLVDNIGTPAGELRVANTASDNVNVTFQYKRGVLTDANAPGRELSLELDDVLANAIQQDARGVGANVEGFKTVNLNAVDGVDINNLTVNEMETLTITGDTFLDIVTLTPTAPVSATEFFTLGAPGINNPAAVGLLNLDASAFTGDLTLDITNSLGGFADPANSGSTVHGVVTGGIGDDTFWSSVGVAATTDTNGDTIDGGAGDNTLILVDGDIDGDATIMNMGALELRNQNVVNDIHNIDFDAFDGNLTTVLMRDEDDDAAAATFNLNDLGAALAADGLVLRHSVSEFAGAAVPVGFNNATVRVRLTDASGADDTVAIRVENDLNTEEAFNYTLNFDGQANGVGAIENVSIDDADTESNIVILTAAQEQTGTLTLTGGVDGQSYTVNSSLVASVIEASAQLSDLRLTVGDTVAPIANVNQDIRLGEGDDILTFANIDDFNASDSISDAGGVDTVRAAFSDDSNLTLAGIENLHIIANDNVTLGMANADIEGLVILADIAADGGLDASPVTAEPFNIAGVAVTDIITLNDTALTELNFFADLDTDDDDTAANRALAQAAAIAADPTWTQKGDSAAGDAAYKTVISDEVTVANFNGVTLANNSANALTVNINASLDDVIYGATAYNLGQLTAHGVTSMDIQISDEDITAGAANAVTTINNIYAKNMTSLSVTAADDVILNTVSGAPLNNSLLTFDASNVGGDLRATVISLGDNAVVTLADGDNVFSALGSAGKDVVITAGNGNNTITGTAQDDTITTGSGWDVVAGDRGDNLITTGGGNDTITAKDGNDTFDVGTGIDTVTDNLSTGIDASLATNTVSMSGGVTTLFIDVVGDGITAGTDVDQMLAVGVGSDLTLSWTGQTLLDLSAVLDGRLAVVQNAAGPATITGDANANLSIIAGAGSILQSTGVAGLATGVMTFNGAGGNDVAMWTGSVAADALVFNGGAGNDAAVGGIDNDIFTGGTGADKLVMQDVAAQDGMIDTVVIADGDSTAANWDVIVGFDETTAGSAIGTVAGTTTAGGDILDLPSTIIEAAAAAGANGVNVGRIQTHLVAANGVIAFGTDDTDGIFNDDLVIVGTGAGQLSLTDAVGYLASNLNGTGSTVMFNYDSDGDTVFTAADSTIIFQDGASDTLIELVGTYTGLESVAAGTGGLINIA
ncbi:MAG: DUF4214 domain-containing protein [Desulfobacterales bacterium]|jgi:hypothetical protein|nr:DUF4214 domain-containing protein [Desulfobacterales bacterium]